MEREFELTIVQDVNDNELGFVLVNTFDGTVYSSLDSDDCERVGASTRIRLHGDWEEIGVKTLSDVSRGELEVLKTQFELSRLYGAIPE